MNKDPDTLPVKDYSITADTTVKELMLHFGQAGGFSAATLASASNIFNRMTKDEDCTVFFSFPACIMATGLRGVIVDMVKRGLVDVIITTCGTLDHDIARTVRPYYSGDFNMDDAALHQKGVNRLGNVLVPNDSYGVVLERFMQPFLSKLYEEGMLKPSSADLCLRLGQDVRDESSLLHWCNKRGVPVFVPGIVDGAVGSQIWLFWQEHKDFNVDILKDQHQLADLVYSAEKTGALMLGGGISKHHTIWWNQFRDGLDYAVGITTAVEHDGSLSGARVKEAISWGKVREDASQVTVEGDATILLPLLVSQLL